MQNKIETTILSKPEFNIPRVAEAAKTAALALTPIKDGKPDNERLFMLDDKHAEIIQKAIAVQAKAVEAMVSYFDLAEALHRHKLDTKVESALLLACGFTPSRVSEIRTVAHCSDRLFKLYADRAIGFRLALQQAREEKGGAIKPKPFELPGDVEEMVVNRFTLLLGEKKKATYVAGDLRVTVVRVQPGKGVAGAESEKMGRSKKAVSKRKK